MVFLFLPQRLARLWGSPSLLSVGPGALSSEVKPLGLRLTTPLLLVPRLRIHGALSPLPLWYLVKHRERHSTFNVLQRNITFWDTIYTFSPNSYILVALGPQSTNVGLNGMSRPHFKMKNHIAHPYEPVWVNDSYSFLLTWVPWFHSVSVGPGIFPPRIKRLECEAGHIRPMGKLRMCGFLPPTPMHFRHIVLGHIDDLCFVGQKTFWTNMNCWNIGYTFRLC